MVEATLDTSKFDPAFALYVKTTSKTAEQAIAFKLFDATREALKTTVAAKRSDIKGGLDIPSDVDPARTVAEMILLKLKRGSGEQITDLENEAQALIRSRYKTIGFTKSGWIPGIRKLLPHIGKESVSVTGLDHESGFGGAIVPKKIGSQINGETWNDVEGTGNKEHVEANKEHAAQAGVDKVTADIAVYLEKELGIPASQFNRTP